jgi:uncharacterized protein
MGCFRHCTVIGLLALLVRSAAAQTPAPSQIPTSAPQTFTVFLGGQSIGTQDVTVRGTLEGWTITSSARLGPPLNIVTRQFEMRYSVDWQPRELTIDAAVNAEPMRLHTRFEGGTAINEITQRGQTTTKTDPVAVDTIVLPSPFFASFQALASRLSRVQPPAELKAYIAPQREVTIAVKAVADERIQIGSQAMPIRRFSITLATPGQPLDADVSIDQSGRLVRLQVPQQSLEVVRQDVATVAARVERSTRSNDESVMIPANGFSLAATLSRPANAAGRLPAVVLVAGSGAADRDEVVAGIPIFALLATALSDAGFVVARYDKRGVGQSGGRLESSTLADYADDLRAVLKSVASRKDVDPKRIAVIGHSEGGAVALLAAAKDDRVAALVTVGAPATSGLDLVLEQQQHALAISKLTDAEKQTAIDFQKRVMQAVMSGEGWEGIPPDVRRRVDTPWYRSFLTFEAAGVVKNVKQPILIVQGALDTQAPPHHGDELLALARARKGPRTSELLKVPGVNHLMVPATTGEVAEYPQLESKTLSPELVRGVLDWLKRTLSIS